MQIESSVVQALKNVGMPENITVVLADRDGVEPKAPYLIVQVIGTSTVGLPSKSVSHEEGNVTEKVYQVKDFDIALTFHAATRGDTHDWIQYFHSGIFSDMVDWTFTQQGLGIVECDDIMYQSQPVDGSNYKRAILNMTLRTEVLNEYKVNNINRIEVVGDLIDELAGKFGEVVVDIPFE